jgi:hypothetical protein
MDLAPANGDTEGLPRISDQMTARDALSEIIGAGNTKGVVEKDGKKRLLTIDTIEALSRPRGAPRG